MTLDFPNQARNYDTTKNRICFWGHDEIMEVSFFVEADALRKLDPSASDSETDLLKAFDASIARIYEAAHKAYKRGKKGSYVYLLRAADF